MMDSIFEGCRNITDKMDDFTKYVRYDKNYKDCIFDKEHDCYCHIYRCDGFSYYLVQYNDGKEELYVE